MIENPEIDRTSEACRLATRFHEEEAKYDCVPNGVLAHMVVPKAGKATLYLIPTPGHS